MRSVLRRQRIDPQAEAAAIFSHVAYFSFGADLAFLNEEVQLQ